MDDLNKLISIFSNGDHGSSSYYKDTIFIQGEDGISFAPFDYLVKKSTEIDSEDFFVKKGFVADSYRLYDRELFTKWYIEKFSRKLKISLSKKLLIFYIPDNLKIINAIEMVNKSYEVLRDQHVILNNKNLPVQLGEWYAKRIFGLKQIKSTSQRGFDLYVKNSRVEIKVEWGDHSSPKGVKIKKSLLGLSEYFIFIYVGYNFMIREVCILDTSFILRKFGNNKGHIIFLKDTDIQNYFFSKSDKHMDKVVNSGALLKFSTSKFTMKIMEYFSENQ